MDRTLAKKTVSSAIWTYLSFILTSLTLLVTTMILTRLLTQEEFGIVGFVLTAMAFFDAVRDVGIGPALIQRNSNVEEAKHTAFWTNLVSNTLMWIIAILLTPAVAAFFNEPAILTIMPVMSITFIINGFSTTHDAILRKDMRFADRAKPQVFSSIAKGAATIILAFMGWHYWSLVFGLIVGRLTFAIAIWFVEEFRPQFRFSPAISLELLKYGYKIAIDSFINALQENIDYVFIGRFLGTSALGLYQVAFRIPELLIMSFSAVLAEVLFPAYASINDDLEKIKHSLLMTLRYSSIILIPAGIGLAMVASLAALVFFSEEWADAGPIMAVLAIYSMLLAISWNLGDAYKAIDRTDILWKTALFEFMLLAPTLFFATQISLVAVAIGHASVAFIVSALRLALAVHILKLPVLHTLSQFVPALVGASVMAPAVYLMISITHTWAPIASLLISVIVGIIVYTLVLWRVENEMFTEIVGIIEWRIRRIFIKDDEDTDQELLSEEG